MIIFTNIIEDSPISLLKKYYDDATSAGQKDINAVCISSYDKENCNVEARFVNLKYVDNYDFIFYTNYNSPKSKQFELHNQISATLFWNNIRLQIRIKAHVHKQSKEMNNKYFLQRSDDKNALAISSNQSEIIDSYQSVIKKYENTLNTGNLSKCPDHWGGYIFVPFEIEFWKGHDHRLNKRSLYRRHGNEWNHFFLEP